MYEMLTSRLPFVGDTAVSVAIQHISAIPLKPREINPEIPIGLEDITMHAMEPDLNTRFSSADEMLYSLEEFRKNPAIIFRFAKSDPMDRQPNRYNDYDNRTVINEPPVVHPTGFNTRQDLQNQRSLKKPEMTRDEYRTAKKRSRNTATLIGIFASVLFIVVLFGFMWFGFLRDWFGEDGELVIIPNFVGQRINRILDDDQYDDTFNFNVIEEYSDDVPVDIVISQSPNADREMPMPLAGTIRINLVVSIGRQPSQEMPDLIGMHFSAARNLLNGLGLDLDIIFEDPVASDDVDSGFVISTRPRFSEPLSRGDIVIITYSGGPDIRREMVPNLVGSQINILLDAFTDLEMTAIIEQREDNSPEGTILHIQSAGQIIMVPADIHVRVSSGPPNRVVTVPDLRGSNRAHVEQTFASLDLIPIFTERHDVTPVGTVISIQNVGQEVTVPIHIQVELSLGPEQIELPPDPDPPPGDG
jgi:serine/threonine-protein kinase